MSSSSRLRLISWALQILAAAILGQTLFFKFTGAPESVHIFSSLGAEPYGRLGVACAEVVAVALLLSGRLAWVGAVLSLGLIVGAIGAHLFTPLGIDVLGDGGLLFGLAVAVFGLCLGILALRRAQAFADLRRLGLPIGKPGASS